LPPCAKGYTIGRSPGSGDHNFAACFLEKPRRKGILSRGGTGAASQRSNLTNVLYLSKDELVYLIAIMKKTSKTHSTASPAHPGQNPPARTAPVQASPVQSRPPQPAAAKTEPPGTQPANPPPKAEPAKTPAVQPAAPAASRPKTGLVSLELVRPGAKQVCVAGSFNDWKPKRTPLRSLGNGRWVGDLAVRPGRHEYLFVVDGQWLPDPNAKESVRNPFGGNNSVLTASE
jgi:hypothetical protein